MFHNNNNKIYEVNIYTNIFYANTIIAKTNINLSMTFSNERSNTK